MTFNIGLSKDFSIGVKTTNGRGFTPEEMAVECASRIVRVSDAAHPALRDQAHAFEAQIAKAVEHYMREAINSDRTTVCNAITNAGHPKLAKLIRRL